MAVLAFGPAGDRKAHQAARDAGADLVISKSQFSRDLAQLMLACLDRHRESEARGGQASDLIFIPEGTPIETEFV